MIRVHDQCLHGIEFAFFALAVHNRVVRMQIPGFVVTPHLDVVLLNCCGLAAAAVKADVGVGQHGNAAVGRTCPLAVSIRDTFRRHALADND